MLCRKSLVCLTLVLFACNDGEIQENPNEPPVAEAGDNVTAQIDEEVGFNGGGSHDPDGTIESYHWDFDDGNTSDIVDPVHSYEQVGTYTVTLTVTDNDGAEGKDSPQVTIAVEEDNQVPFEGTYAVTSIPSSQQCALSQIQFASTNVVIEIDGANITSDWGWDNVPAITLVSAPTGTLSGDAFTQTWVEKQTDTSLGSAIYLIYDNTWTGVFDGQGGLTSHLMQNMTVDDPDGVLGGMEDLVECSVTWPNVAGTKI